MAHCAVRGIVQPLKCRQDNMFCLPSKIVFLAVDTKCAPVVPLIF